MADTLFIVPFQQMLYQWLLEAVSVSLWEIARAGLLAGYVVERVSNWAVAEGFSSTIGLLTGQGQPIFVLFAAIAVILLGISYVLAAWVRVRVVDWRPALGWLLFGLLFYSLAPGLYAQTEAFRRQMASGFYQILITQANLADLRSDLGGISPGASTGVAMVTDQFNDGYIDGLDVAMAYVLADRNDVLLSPDTLPVAYRAEYGDPTIGAANFLVMTPEERGESIVLVTQGIGRLVLVWVIALFGIFEQLIYLLLSIAAGLLFVQMAIALPFALFVRTELMARTLIDMWIELFVKTAVIALFQAFGVSLVLIGAETGNPVLTVGTSLIGGGLMAIFLVSAARAIWDGLNRLFAALSSLVGNRVMQPGHAALAAAGAAAGVASAGIGLAAGVGLAAASGGAALASGATQAQALGAALGKTQAIYSAAALGSRLLPEGSPRQQAAQEVFEGALYRRMIGPVGAVALGAHADQYVAPEKNSTQIDVDLNRLAEAIGQAVDRAPAGGHGNYLNAALDVAQRLNHPIPRDLAAFGSSTFTIGSVVTHLHQAGVAGDVAQQAVLQAGLTGGLTQEMADQLQQAGRSAGIRHLDEQISRAGEALARRTRS